jgi:hypothetical protein
MSINEFYAAQLAAEAAARHRTPVAEFDHPKGVIVPHSELLTDNIRNDRDYVPYCGPCVPMQRMRRSESGFYCPTCLNKTNWDLTPFNNNVDVQFDTEYVDPVWLAEHQANVQAIKNHEALHKETYADFQARQAEEEAIKKCHQKAANHAVETLLGWTEDNGKKNTSVHNCNKCSLPFFGKKSRKYCPKCQNRVSEQIKQNAYVNSPYQRTKAERRGKRY